jgi:hypothetical protein
VENKKMIPVGIEDFKEIVSEKFYYVDKTGFIRDLLKERSKVTLFTRPRRFGKSLNMSMLRHFFEIGTSPSLFDGLAISKENELCEQYLGKYPVISISLKSIEGLNFDDACAMAAHILIAEARRHAYLMESDQLLTQEKNSFEELLAGTEAKNSPDALKNGLWLLSSLLHKHFDSKVIVLIDEYDVPLAKAFENGYYPEMVSLIRGLFERLLKTNDNLQFAVLTGCMRIAKESIFTGLNNLRIQSITSPQFDDYFGFTDQEIRDVLAYYDLSEKFSIVKAWYDGYKFGNASVYCPWDVLNYLYDLRTELSMPPQNYWSNTSGNDIVRRFLDKADDTTRWEIEQLVAGKTIEKEIYQELTYAELDLSIDHLWSVLLTTGYLTRETNADVASNDVYSTIGSGLQNETVLLKIPNEEIRSVFKNQIMTWFKDQVKTDAARYTTFTQALIDGDAAKIQDMFNAYLKETISIRDTSVRQSMKENFYHGVLLGILKFRRDWIVRSNQEAGDGYNDIMIMYNAQKVGMIIEVKYAEHDDLDAECQKALAQIENLHYADALEEFEPKKIYKYAISCYKKHCRVLVEQALCE